MDIAYAGVTFINIDSKIYTYKFLKQLNLQKGDTVVVPVGANSRLSIATVVGIKDALPEEPKYKLKYIIDKVDFTLYNSIFKENELLSTEGRK